VPWYELPRVWREMRQSNARMGRVFNGYRQVAREYLLRPFITAEHPFSRGA
jgi:fatty acid desaturase